MFAAEEITYEKPVRYTFSQSLLEKIRSSTASGITENLSDVTSDESRLELQNILSAQPSNVLSEFQFNRACTDGVHDVTFGQQPIGDFFFSDLLSSVYNFKSGSNVLDFGCSTGRVIRNLRSVYDFNAYGCDPRSASIEFNKKNFKDVEWFVSNPAPPLLDQRKYEFDMVFAISVWSHFSEEYALMWFDEMHKQMIKGGKLIFTTHGTRSVYHFHNVLEKMPSDKAEERLSVLRDGGIHFMPYPSSNNDLENSDWGMTFISKSWLEESLKRSWKISDYKQGIAMKNQDLYILEKI